MPENKMVVASTTASPHLSFSVDRFRKQLSQEISQVLDLMEKTWGFRPPVTLKSETCLVVTADFHLKDFAHQGARSYIRAETVDKRNHPRAIARRILGELVLHKDDCQECGTGLPTIYNKIRCLESFLHPCWPGQTFSYPLPVKHPLPERRSNRGNGLAEVFSTLLAQRDRVLVLAPNDLA